MKKIICEIKWLVFFIILFLIFSIFGVKFSNFVSKKIGESGFSFFLYLLILTVLLVLLFSSRKKAYKNISDGYKDDTSGIIRWVLDFVLALCLLFALSVWNAYFLKMKVYSYTVNEIINSVTLLFFVLYILNTSVKNFLHISYFATIIILVLCYLIGRISLENWAFISLLVVIANSFLNFEDSKIFFLINNKHIKNNQIDIKKSKKNFAFAKVGLNFFVVGFYLFIYLTQEINISGRINSVLFKDDKKIPETTKLIYHGVDRIFLLTVCILICIFIYKKGIFKNEFDKIVKFLNKLLKKLFVIRNAGECSMGNESNTNIVFLGEEISKKYFEKALEVFSFDDISWRFKYVG